MSKKTSVQKLERQNTRLKNKLKRIKAKEQMEADFRYSQAIACLRSMHGW